jgi:hypothetical protein
MRYIQSLCPLCTFGQKLWPVREPESTFVGDEESQAVAAPMAKPSGASIQPLAGRIVSRVALEETSAARLRVRRSNPGRTESRTAL